jgi:hypothetical protein
MFPFINQTLWGYIQNEIAGMPEKWLELSRKSAIIGLKKLYFD